MRQRPRSGGNVGLKEIEQDVGFLFATLWIGRVNAIVVHIFTSPKQTISSGSQPVRPIVWPPGHPRRHDGSFAWIVIEGGVAIDLVLNRPLHGKARLIGEWLRIKRVSQPIRVSVVKLAAVVNQFQVGKKSM